MTMSTDPVVQISKASRPKDRSPTLIPKIIHQLWKDESIPPVWADNVESVKRYHPGWEYRLWTDGMMDDYVREKHPDLYPVYSAFTRHIMRVDVFRYVLMYDFGGLYCDLDFEFLRPFDYGDAEVVLSLERDEAFGDPYSGIANFIMVSVPGHPYWADVLEDVKSRPPVSQGFKDVPFITGPGLVSRVFFDNRDRYEGIVLTPQPTFSPRRVHGQHERKIYLNSGVTFGFHHGWGSWKERWQWAYIGPKIKSMSRKLFGKR